ncbi:unnamed protein product [Rotaria sp. Silwood1]|nr:unnamed protein product [Rotaria sp. Silwood1]CAF1641690.1 unnamed protein product [Rotaria sp. Silwood1]CAF3825974.1 unnamed protein product [Rotaria sp. Silwood1]CAF3901990.1 unnamed protein product [Rotaria sp. Silwood1]CAF4726394.1 unnamed protein product [Rotaria sp. Silwood1]
MSKPTSPHENLTKFRYTDLLAEPIARLLSPIKGYEAAPLVSLEQAVTSIAIFFDCIEENVWIVKENSKTPSDGLNQDESVAVHLYTMQFDSDPSFYQLLNLTLRGENSDNFKRCSTLSPPMQEAVINIIREAIVEGTDEEDIKSIIVSELIQYYGGTWWVHITPTPET